MKRDRHTAIPIPRPGAKLSSKHVALPALRASAGIADALSTMLASSRIFSVIRSDAHGRMRRRRVARIRNASGKKKVFAMPAKTKPPEPAPESILSLTYRGALPEILRKIADEIEFGSATAEHFTSRVSRDVYELSATIHLMK